MPITTIYAPITYAGDGVTTAFPVTFPFQLQTDLVVTTTVIATGVPTTLTLGTDYTVSPILNSPASTGTVVVTTPVASTLHLTIARAVPVTQLTSWVPNDPNLSTSVMNAVDKLTMIVQDSTVNPLDPGGDTSTFVRGDGSLSNTLVPPASAFTVPSDVQTLFTAGQNAAAAIRVVGGTTSQVSYSFANDGSANSWDMRLTYDPSITAWGWQKYGGSLLGTFDASGNVFASGNLTITGDASIGGTANASLFVGAADASLITTGTIDTARLGSGAASSNTFLRGDQTWAVVSGGGGGINTTTTGTFVIAAVNSTQTVPVTATTGIVVGSDLQISDGTHLITGLVTNIASLNLTVQTQAIVLGSAGNTMASGAAVQSGIAPGNNTIQVQDLVRSPASVTNLAFAGSTALSNSTVDLYITGIGGGTAGISGYVNSNFIMSTIHAPLLNTADYTAVVRSGATHWTIATPAATGDVWHGSAPGALTFGKLTAPDSIVAATITPALLNVTNALTDTYLFGYDNASGHFKMFAPASALPGGGTTATFLRGDSTWSNELSQAGVAQQNLVLGDSAGNQLILAGGGGFNPAITNKTGNVIDHQTGLVLGQPMIAGISGTSPIDTAGAISTWPVEGGLVQGWFRAMSGVRSTSGVWAQTVVTNNPASTLTLDVATVSYQRITGMTGNCTVTIKDSTPLPSNSSYRYAGELVVEVVAPGANTITWAAFGAETITWANGGSAPTLSASGTNIIRFTRRQGVSGWLASVDVSNSTGTYTDGQARSAVLSPTYIAGSSSISVTQSGGVGTQMVFSIPSSSVTNAMLAGGIQTSKLQLPGGTTNFLRADGTWAAPSGGGTAFNPAADYNLSGTNTYSGTGTFSGANTFSNDNTFTRSWGGGTTSTVRPNLLYAGAVPLVFRVDVFDFNVSTEMRAGDFYHVTYADKAGGLNSFQNWLDMRGTESNANTFSIATTLVNQSANVGFASNDTRDAVWMNSWGPSAEFSASPASYADGTTKLHSFGSSGGIVRIGECNYGNAWADQGFQARRGLAGYFGGLEFFPDWLPGTITNAVSYQKFNAQWAIAIGGAAAGPVGGEPKNWIGLLVNRDGIVGANDYSAVAHGNTNGGGGYALQLWGNQAGNPIGKAINVEGYVDVGIDLSAATFTNTGTSLGAQAIALADDQSIRLGTVWLRGHSGALQYSTNGTAWSNVTLP